MILCLGAGVVKFAEEAHLGPQLHEALLPSSAAPAGSKVAFTSKLKSLRCFMRARLIAPGLIMSSSTSCFSNPVDAIAANIMSSLSVTGVCSIKSSSKFLES